MSNEDVFINCPFDDEYEATFDAMIFTIFACGFRPRSALELEDGSQTRIEKLYGIIGECRFGIHDLSRTELDPVNKLPRFNMPLELGVFLGAKRFGGRDQKSKRCLIMDIEPYRYQRFISDLSGVDIKDHKGEPLRAARIARDWLTNVSGRDIRTPAQILKLYHRFELDRLAIQKKLGFDEGRLSYADYQNIVTAWLLEA